MGVREISQTERVVSFERCDTTSGPDALDPPSLDPEPSTESRRTGTSDEGLNTCGVIPMYMNESAEEPNSPYVFREERESPPSHDPEEREVVIVDGRAMSYRMYRR